MGAAHPLDLALLDGAQQLGLQLDPKVADLIEEQRPAAGQLELPELLADRAGKRPLFVSEQGAFDQFLRNRRQVHRDERAGWIGRLAVDQAGQQLLAGAAFAKDQHRRRELRDLLDQLDDLTGGAARADDEFAVVLLGDLGTEPHDVPAQVLPLAGVGHERADPFDVKILGDVVIRSVTHRLDGGVELLQDGDDDHLDVGVVLLDDLEDLEAADAGEPDVEQHEVDVLFLHDLQRGFAGRGLQQPVVAPEDGRQRVAHAFIVIDDEDGFAAFRHGGPRV